MKLPKAYEPASYEQSVYSLWEEAGAFKPGKGHERFSMVLPPPNATGRLHVGHAAMLAIEDTIARHQRMIGKSVLWVPGTDHAAIATNAIMEKQLQDEGTTKHDIGREEFLKRLHEYVDQSIDDIRSQVKAMGASVDWSRERYTMEEAMNRVVSEVFVKMYNDGLIYRGNRIVNWDPKMQTTVADDELEYAEERATLYTLQYGPFQISTARPETKFGDKYVVMHPDDKRYAKYKHGDTFEAEWINGTVKATVIKDEAVNPEFGTGVMTITPWHDATDFDIAQKHKLDKEQIIDFDGRLMDIAGDFKGMTIEEARPAIVERLKEKGLVIKEDNSYVHNVAVNYRGKGVVEPQIKRQWFVDVNKPVVKWHGRKKSLKEVMQAVVKDGDITIMPKRFDKIYFHWIDHLRDWCVSRQIWWGHRIPAWYREGDESKGIEVSLAKPKKGKWEQDHDTLDTWFSSALWSWSTLIDPKVAANPKYDLHDMLRKSPDFKRYHPLDLMETGYDILFFWVARMILMTTYVTGEVPFKTVYLHGLVRTKDGKKMSKSDPETAIDPLEVIREFGADAIRLSLLVGQSPGSDNRIYKEKIAGYRNFNNKLWNIARFVEGRLSGNVSVGTPKPVHTADYWILNRLAHTSEEVSKRLAKYDLGRAYEVLYHFIWDDFADWYIEVSKVELNEQVLAYVLATSLELTHPFAPFVTEAIWQTLNIDKVPLVSRPWPRLKRIGDKEAKEFEQIREIVSEIRHLRTALQLRDNRLYYRESEFISNNANLIKKLTGLVGIRQIEAGQGLHLTRADVDAWLDVEYNVMRDYLMQLIKRRDEHLKNIETLSTRLANKKYVRSAPRELVDETRRQLEQEKQLASRLSSEIESVEFSIENS